ncbi:MAG: hydrolase [Erysipelotrichaceae bacterium]|nr:hydrolase [Erysipelotrichaceae bacterium]
MNQANIEKFEAMLTQYNRPGMDKLIEYIRKSDFYTAPASTRFHSCHEGGLLEHSLNVADCLLKKLDNPVWADILNEVGQESIIISALLHDICKSNFYVVELKNKKVYSDHGKKSDSNGRYDWETVPGYAVDDKIPYGHGEKSVMMIEEFMKLKPVERYAIRWHMGFTELKENWNTLSLAIKKYPLVLAIFEADLESTYIIEEEN